MNLIALITRGGQRIEVNADDISSLEELRGDGKHSVRITLTNTSQFYSNESLDELKDRILMPNAPEADDDDLSRGPF
jgi:hypothetical protein